MVMLLEFEPTLYLQNECVWSLYNVSWQALEDLNKWDICKWIGIPAFSADCSGSTSENSSAGGHLWFYVASMGEETQMLDGGLGQGIWIHDPPAWKLWELRKLRVWEGEPWQDRLGLKFIGKFRNQINQEEIDAQANCTNTRSPSWESSAVAMTWACLKVQSLH